MASNFPLACTVCTVMAFFCGIASLATTNWINGCVLFEAVIKATKDLVDFQAYENIIQLHKSTFCHNSGIFRVSAKMLAYQASEGPLYTSNPQDRFLRVVGGLLICAIILLGFALILFSVSANSRDSSNHERKITSKSYSRIAAGFLLFGCIFYGAGMVTYTVNQSKVIHNYRGYMTQIGPSFNALYSSKPGITGLDGNNLPVELDRKQNQDIFIISVILWFDQQDYKLNVLSIKNQNDLRGLNNKTLKAFSKMDPVFSSSYYAAWIGLAFAIFALVLGVLDLGFNSSLNFSNQLRVVLKA